MRDLCFNLAMWSAEVARGGILNDVLHKDGFQQLNWRRRDAELVVDVLLALVEYGASC